MNVSAVRGRIAAYGHDVCYLRIGKRAGQMEHGDYRPVLAPKPRELPAALPRTSIGSGRTIETIPPGFTRPPVTASREISR